MPEPEDMFPNAPCDTGTAEGMSRIVKRLEAIQRELDEPYKKGTLTLERYLKLREEAFGLFEHLRSVARLDGDVDVKILKNDGLEVFDW